MNLIFKPKSLPQQVIDAATEAVQNSLRKGFDSHFNLKFENEKLSLQLNYISTPTDCEITVEKYDIKPTVFNIVEPTGTEKPVIVPVGLEESELSNTGKPEQAPEPEQAPKPAPQKSTKKK